MTPDTTTSQTEGKAPRKALAVKSTKMKPPARPHRRLPLETLESRLRDMHKKKSIAESKLVLLTDRLESLTKEKAFRDTNQAAEDA